MDTHSHTPTTEWMIAFEAWCSHQRLYGRLRRGSSEAVYRAMWRALAAWCAAQAPPLRLTTLDSDSLLRYLASRNGMGGPGEALTPRYQWRLLSLVRWVQSHQPLQGPQRTRPHSDAAAHLIAGQPSLRRANAAHDNTPPSCLSDPDCAQLLAALLTWFQTDSADGRDAKPADAKPADAMSASTTSALASSAVMTPAAASAATTSAHGEIDVVNPSLTDAQPPEPRWQTQRNRCAVALQLGAGLGPGDVRALRLVDVLVTGSPPYVMLDAATSARTSVRLAAHAPRPPTAHPSAPSPIHLRVPASGSAPLHVTPLAPWAAQALMQWLQWRQQEALGGPWLFPSTRSGKPWGKVAQYGSVHQVLTDAGLVPGAGGSFRLRHSFALRQLQAGQAPETVARWLGVVDPEVILRYARLLGPSRSDADAGVGESGQAKPTLKHPV